MISIRHVIRGVTPLLVLALSVGAGAAAFGIRVAPHGSTGPAAPTPITTQGGSSPLWEFLVVAVGAVLVTVLAIWLITRVRHEPGHPSHA